MFDEHGDNTGEYRKISNLSSYRGEFGQRLRSSESENDLACFAAYMAQECLLEFTWWMRGMFGDKVKLGAKTGTARIADKLMADVKERGVSLKIALGSLTDLLRLTVNCRTPREVINTLYTCTQYSDYPARVQILRLKPRMNSFLADCAVNFNWRESCCCELQIKLSDGSVARAYYLEHSLYEVKRACATQDLFFVQQAITQRVNWLLEHNQIEFDEKVSNCESDNDNFTKVFKANKNAIEQFIKTTDQ